jgi:transcriptional regulator with XRE-family HTH domain
MAPNLRELLYDETRIIPNRLTIAQGELVRQARTEAGLSQAELARRVYLKQSSVSKIEAGNRSISTEDLLYLCLALDKPIGYFFPPRVSRELPQGDSSPLEQELLLQARRLTNDDLRKVIAQVRAIASVKPSPDQPSAEDYREIANLLGLKPEKKRRKKK